MNMSVIPPPDKAEVNLEKLAITVWELEDFDEDKKIATIRINFSFPLDISSGIEQDTLRVEFFSQNFTSLLKNDSLTIFTPCKKQMEPSTFNLAVMESAEKQSKALMVLLVFSILINFLTQFAWTSKYLFILVRSLQMVIHFPLFRVLL